MRDFYCVQLRERGGASHVRQRSEVTGSTGFSQL